jgi:hypothetical protein
MAHSAELTENYQRMVIKTYCHIGKNEANFTYYVL